ncbi:MAG TPA: DUF6600 domain-containing protein [Thermoanaerobaculia bacterium]|nr:DUF6600 domain-containing protein [Thermoanaerobaculia bacterium]
MNTKRFVLSILLAAGVALGATTKPLAAYDSRTSVRVEVGFFYDELAPYGDWRQDTSYGWAWSPRHVSSDWRPYTEGRWVDSDYGWTWVSDEPYGWATYHYGRWVFDPDYGWLWIPGSVWAPAWVSWQHGDGYVGWAPLPPQVGFEVGFGLRLGGLDLRLAVPASEYVFVQENRFLEPRPYRYAAPRSRNVVLCRETRNVTRYDVRGGRVFNRGVEVDRIERAIHRRVPRFNAVETRSVRSVGVQNNQVRIFRPSTRELGTVRIARRNDAGVRPGVSPARPGARPRAVPEDRRSRSRQAPPVAIRPNQPNPGQFDRPRHEAKPKVRPPQDRPQPRQFDRPRHEAKPRVRPPQDQSQPRQFDRPRHEAKPRVRPPQDNPGARPYGQPKPEQMNRPRHQERPPANELRPRPEPRPHGNVDRPRPNRPNQGARPGGRPDQGGGKPNKPRHRPPGTS